MLPLGEPYLNSNKALLSKAYREAQQAKRDVIKYKKHSDQYQELYEVTNNYNDELKQELKELGVSTDTI